VASPISDRLTAVHTVHLPPWPTVLHQAARQLVENTLAPLLVFWAILVTVGLFWAFVGALGLCYLSILVRLVRRRPVPALLLLGAALLTARSVIGIATGSAFLYFLQPSLGNFLIGGLFLLSVPFGRPLAGRLAGEFCAFPSGLVGHQRLRAFFRRVSLLWAFVFCANGAVTIWMLISVPLTRFLFLSFSSSTGLIVMGVGLSLWWFRRSLARAGVRLRLGGPAPAPAALG
jgi:Protein of unknown function (DUF3159)